MNCSAPRAALFCITPAEEGSALMELCHCARQENGQKVLRFEEQHYLLVTYKGPGQNAGYSTGAVQLILPMPKLG